MKNNKYLALIAFTGLLTFVSCKKDKVTEPEAETPVTQTPAYTVPTSYNSFKNVDHTESTTIIGMLSEMSTEIAKGTGVGSAMVPTPLDATHLKNLFSNQGGQFMTNAAYNASGFQIKSNCLASSQTDLESYLDTLVKVSNSGTLAASGIAGLGLSKDATPKRYLLTSGGVNYSQIFFKNIMCDLVLNQITKRVTDNSLDNSASVTGKNYTAMEHNWDVAFGYYSVPDSFPIVKTPLKYWGSYSNQVDAGLGCNKIMMDAFLKGRAAISNKDMDTKNAQAAIIVSELDRMTAGAVVQELNEIQTAIGANDVVKMVSAVTECKGFVMSMQNNKNAGRIITDAQILTMLGYFPANLWTITSTDLNNIKALIASVYGFTPAQLLIL